MKLRCIYSIFSKKTIEQEFKILLFYTTKKSDRSNNSDFLILFLAYVSIWMKKYSQNDLLIKAWMLNLRDNSTLWNQKERFMKKFIDWII